MNLNLTDKIYLCIAIAAVVFIPVIFCAVHGRKRIMRHSLQRNCYFVYASPALFILGIIATFIYFLVLVAIIFTTDVNIVEIAVFLSGAFLAEFYCYLTVTYEIKCDANSLTIYRPPLPPKRIMLYEITKVLCMENRRGMFAGGQMHLYLYQGEKKLLNVDSDMIGFYRLMKQLKPGRKLERGSLKEYGIELGEIKDEFSVTETTEEKIRAIFFLLFFGGIVITILWNWEEMLSEGVGDSVFFLICFLVLTVISLKNFLCKILRKITVSYRTITIRDALGRTASYSMGEITRVLEKKHDMEIYANEKMIVRVGKDDKNYVLLVERFLREGLMGTDAVSAENQIEVEEWED